MDGTEGKAVHTHSSRHGGRDGEEEVANSPDAWDGHGGKFGRESGVRLAEQAGGEMDGIPIRSGGDGRGQPTASSRFSQEPRAAGAALPSWPRHSPHTTAAGWPQRRP